MLPGIASAADAMDYYTAGNGDAVFNIFNSISALTNDPTYIRLLNGTAILGFIFLIARSGLSASTLSSGGIGHLIMILAVMAGLNGKTNITIVDTVNNTVNVADNVPWIVGTPAAIVSNVSHGLTSKLEQTFNMPNGVKMSDGGSYGMVPSMLKDLDKVVIVDPNINSSLRSYFSDCIVPMLANGVMDGNILIKSPNLWRDLKSDNPAIMTTYYAGGGQAPDVKTCEDAYTTLDTALNANMPAIMANMAGDFSGTAMAGGLLSAKLEASANYASGNLYQGTGAELVKQAAIVDYVRTGKGFTEALAAEQAIATQTNSWLQGGQIFKQLAGYIHLMLTAMVLASSALVLPILVMPNGTRAAAHFAKVLAYLALWEPLLALVNGVVMYSAVGQLSGNFTAGELTYDAIPALSAAAQHIYEVGGWLAAMVPALAWFIVSKGGHLAVDVIGQAAHAAGAGMATGNVSHQQYSNNNINRDNITQRSVSSDNATWRNQQNDNTTNSNVSQGNSTLNNSSWNNATYNNTSANKFNTRKESTTGDLVGTHSVIAAGSSKMTTVLQQSGAEAIMRDGQIVYTQASAGTSQQITEAKSNTQSLMSKKTEADAKRDEATQNFTQAYAASNGYSYDKRHDTYTKDGETFTASVVNSKAVAKVAELAHNQAVNHNSSVGTTNTAGGSLRFGAGSKDGALIAAGAEVNTGTTAQAKNENGESRGDSTKDSQSSNVGLNVSDSTAKDRGNGSNDSKGNTQTKQASVSENEANSRLLAASKTLTDATEKSDQYARSLSEAQAAETRLTTTVSRYATAAEVAAVDNGAAHLEKIGDKMTIVEGQIAKAGENAAAATAQLDAKTAPGSAEAPAAGSAKAAAGDHTSSKLAAATADHKGVLNSPAADRAVHAGVPNAPKHADHSGTNADQHLARGEKGVADLNRHQAAVANVMADRTKDAGENPVHTKLKSLYNEAADYVGGGTNRTIAAGAAHAQPAAHTAEATTPNTTIAAGAAAANTAAPAGDFGSLLKQEPKQPKAANTAPAPARSAGSNGNGKVLPSSKYTGNGRKL